MITELDANYIGKLERGLIHWPQALYREALRVVLHTENDVHLGFSGRRRNSLQPLDADVGRHRTLALAGTVASLPWLDLYIPIEPTPVPAEVTRADIAHVRVAAKTFLSWNRAHVAEQARYRLACIRGERGARPWGWVEVP